MKRLLVVALIAGCRRGEPTETEPPPVAVRCLKAEAADVDVTLAVRGRIEPPPGGDLSITPQVSGRIVSVAVHEGQRVAAGDLIATVDEGPSLDAVRQAEASRAQAIANDTNAMTTLDRTRTLVARGIAAKQELDDATARADAAHASVVAANASLDLARRTLGRVAVRTSLAGVVTKVLRGVGAVVDGSAQTPIAQLAAVQGVELVADVTDRELARIAEGQEVRGTLGALAAEIHGVVRARSRALDPATGLGTVRMTIEGLPESVPIGAFGRVVITLEHRKGVRVVPSTAVRGAVADGVEVAICKSDTVEIRPVKIGWRDAERVEIVEGVAPDERVAIDHVLGLETGTPVHVE